MSRSTLLKNKNQSDFKLIKGMDFDRVGPIPLYFQLSQKLESFLFENNCEPGELFFSDKQLIEQTGLSLLTVRQAVKELVKKGLLGRQKGRGTFISPSVVEFNYQKKLSHHTVIFSGWIPHELSSWDAMFFQAITSGISTELKDQNMRMVFDQVEKQSNEKYAMNLTSDHIAGAIVMIGKNSEEKARNFVKLGIKTITIGFSTDGASAILPDSYHGGILATKHLLSSGCKIISHLNSGERHAFHWFEAKRAFCDTINNIGLPTNKPIILESKMNRGSIEAGYELTKKLLAEFPLVDGIFAGNDLMGIGALQYLAEQNICVPESIKVIGFDNTDMSIICSPQLSTIDINSMEMGRKAVQQLIGIGNYSSEKVIILQPASIIMRRSTVI